MKITFSPQNSSFGNLKRDPNSIDEKLFNEISKTHAINGFSKNYNANISIEGYMQNNNKTSLYLFLENIKPKNLIEKITNIITNKKLNSSILIKTHATNHTELVDSLKKVKLEKIKELLVRK